MADSEAPEGWVSLKDHLLALREADDRRYAEVNVEREKALKIKETADRDALGLAREIQTYKDEKANELREQISSERGRYVTREELASAVREIQASIKPLTEYATSDAGRTAGVREVVADTRQGQALSISGWQLLIAAVVLAIGLYATFHK